MPPMFHLKHYEFLVEVAFPACKIDLDTYHVTAVGDLLGRHCASSGLPAGRLYVHPSVFYVSNTHVFRGNVTFLCNQRQTKEKKTEHFCDLKMEQ